MSDRRLPLSPSFVFVVVILKVTTSIFCFKGIKAGSFVSFFCSFVSIGFFISSKDSSWPEILEYTKMVYLKPYFLFLLTSYFQMS